MDRQALHAAVRAGDIEAVQRLAAEVAAQPILTRTARPWKSPRGSRSWKPSARLSKKRSPS